MITRIIGLFMLCMGSLAIADGYSPLRLTWILVGIALFMIKRETQSD